MSGNLDIGLIIITVVLICFLIATISIFLGHGSFFIGGLKFNSEEDYKNFDFNKYFRFIGCCFIIFDLALALVFISYLFKLVIIGVIASILFLITSFGATIYLKTGERFRKK